MYGVIVQTDDRDPNEFCRLRVFWNLIGCQECAWEYRQGGEHDQFRLRSRSRVGLLQTIEQQESNRSNLTPLIALPFLNAEGSFCFGQASWAAGFVMQDLLRGSDCVIRSVNL